MNTEPPTGDDLTRMLVSMKKNVLERATDTTRRRPGRRFGIAFGLVALIGLGSAGGAVAMGFVPSPFEGLAQPEPTAVVSTPPAPTPTATPTPEPSAAPSTQPVGGTPEPYLPIDCATLATESSLTSLLRAPNLLTDDLEGPFAPVIAAEDQFGLDDCNWDSTSETAYASFAITSAPRDARASEAVASDRAEGAVDIGIGDQSTQICTEYLGCRGTVLVGDYWLDYYYGQSVDFGEDARALLLAHLERIADVVEPLDPRAPWVATDAAARWTRTGDCSTISLATPLSVLFSDPAIADGARTPDYERNGRLLTAARDSSYYCEWAVPEATPPTEMSASPPAVTVQIAAGARWGFEAREEYLAGEAASAQGADVTPMTVVGAEDATIFCLEAGVSCSLDVLVDDSWMRVSYNGQRTIGEKPVLIAVAESIIAAR